jgi:hypothetical protein
MATYIPDPAQRVEEVLLDFLSSSFVGSGLIDPATEWLTGMSQVDKEGPACIAACNSADEVYLGTRVYRFDLDITTKQIAWDSTTSSAVTGSMINFGGNVHAMFGDPVSSSLAVNQFMASGSNDFYIYQIQQNGYESMRVDDAWISNQKLLVIGMFGPTAGLLSYFGWP